MRVIVNNDTCDALAQNLGEAILALRRLAPTQKAYDMIDAVLDHRSRLDEPSSMLAESVNNICGPFTPHSLKTPLKIRLY